MKRYFRNDWTYNQDDSDNIKALKEIMMSNMSHQDDPELAIFWYDPAKDELFGVKTADIDGVPFQDSNLFSGKKIKTPKPLHYKVWQKEYWKGKDDRFQGSFTKYPRGRVFYVEDEGFTVVVGDWINKYPAAKNLIKFEFNLPENTKFEINQHWSVGHGDSDKFI